MPAVARHHEGQHRGQHHGAGHGDTVGCRQRRGSAEHQDDQHHGGQQRPVDHRNVDLADFPLGSVADVDPRTVAELHGLAGQRIGAGNHRLRCDHRGGRGQHHQRQGAPGRCQVEERVFHCGRVGQQQRTLAEIIERQRRQHQPEPRPADRPPAEVAHVGVECFASGQGQHHGAQREEGRRAVFDEKHHGVDRIECLEHLRILQDLPHAQSGQRAEPQHHDRPEQRPDARRAEALQQEQRHQHGQGQRQHVGFELRCHHRQPFDGRQHRNGRRDHRIAVKQRSTGNADDHQSVAPARPGPLGERHQRHHAALAAVVGPQDVGHVLERHHQRDRPENQRQDAQHVARGRRQPVERRKAFLQGIKRARPDITKHDTQCGQDQRRQGVAVFKVLHAAIYRYCGRQPDGNWPAL